MTRRREGAKSENERPPPRLGPLAKRHLTSATGVYEAKATARRWERFQLPCAPSRLRVNLGLPARALRGEAARQRGFEALLVRRQGALRDAVRPPRQRQHVVLQRVLEALVAEQAGEVPEDVDRGTLAGELHLDRLERRADPRLRFVDPAGDRGVRRGGRERQLDRELERAVRAEQVGERGARAFGTGEAEARVVELVAGLEVGLVDVAGEAAAACVGEHAFGVPALGRRAGDVGELCERIDRRAIAEQAAEEHDVRRLAGVGGPLVGRDLRGPRDRLEDDVDLAVACGARGRQRGVRLADLLERLARGELLEHRLEAVGAWASADEPSFY